MELSAGADSRSLLVTDFKSQYSYGGFNMRKIVSTLAILAAIGMTTPAFAGHGDKGGNSGGNSSKSSNSNTNKNTNKNTSTATGTGNVSASVSVSVSNNNN